MKKGITRAIALLVSLAVGLFVAVGAASTASAKPPNTGGGVTAPVEGTAAFDDGTAGNFVGTFDVSAFSAQNGKLLATGTLTGTVTNTTTGALTAVEETVTFVVQQAQGSCKILDLTLGPLELDLLGLVIELDEVHLEITAQQGPGNLLGNLLCAIAGLLNGPTGLTGLLQQIVNLLNQILAILG
jgi:hypothetical protein